MPPEEPIVETPESAPTINPSPAVAAPAAPSPGPVAVATEPAPAAPVVAEKPAEKVPHPAERPTALELAGRKKDEPKAEAKPADKAAEAKPADKPEGDKPAEAKPEAEPAKAEAEPDFATLEYNYKFPDNIKADKAAVDEWTSFARDFKIPPESAQKAVDMFNRAATDFATAYDKQQTERQFQVWNDMRSEWTKQRLADPILGGNNAPIVEKAAARMRDEYVSDAPVGSERFKREHAQFDEMLRVTGAGDHPALWRFLRNMAVKLDEPRAPAPGGKPTPYNGRKSGASSLYREKQ